MPETPAPAYPPMPPDFPNLAFQSPLYKGGPVEDFLAARQDNFGGPMNALFLPEEYEADEGTAEDQLASEMGYHIVYAPNSEDKWTSEEDVPTATGLGSLGTATPSKNRTLTKKQAYQEIGRNLKKKLQINIATAAEEKRVRKQTEKWSPGLF